MNHNEFALIHHNKITVMGYWKKDRALGELLMLMVTEITKLFNEGKLNKPEKVADVALRIYDFCGKYKVDLTELPVVETYGLWDMINQLTNELEAYRAGFNHRGQYVKTCLAMCYKYAEQNNIDLIFELQRKSRMLDHVKIKLL